MKVETTGSVERYSGTKVSRNFSFTSVLFLYLLSIYHGLKMAQSQAQPSLPAWKLRDNKTRE